MRTRRPAPAATALLRSEQRIRRWSGGYGTHFVIDPCENLFATVLTQRTMQGPGDDRIGRELFTLTYAALDSWP